MICALDCETTGLIPGRHDILQLALVPLDDTIEPHKNIPPFRIYMKPKRFRPEDLPEISGALIVNKIDINWVIRNGYTHDVALDLFDKYIKQYLGKIQPLCQNYPFDSAFVKDWLGAEQYAVYFDRQYRDTYSLANALKDKARLKGLPDPFPKSTRLTALAESLGINIGNAHDAFFDCLTTAAVYKEMLLKF